MPCDSRSASEAVSERYGPSRRCSYPPRSSRIPQRPSAPIYIPWSYRLPATGTPQGPRLYHRFHYRTMVRLPPATAGSDESRRFSRLTSMNHVHSGLAGGLGNKAQRAKTDRLASRCARRAPSPRGPYGSSNAKRGIEHARCRALQLDLNLESAIFSSSLHKDLQFQRRGHSASGAQCPVKCTSVAGRKGRLARHGLHPVRAPSTPAQCAARCCADRRCAAAADRRLEPGREVHGAAGGATPTSLI
jgi:hypothetical protein